MTYKGCPKDLQPQICDAMESLLAEINSQEDIQVHFSRSSYNKGNTSKPFHQNQFRRKDDRSPQSRPILKQSSGEQHKECFLCNAVGRNSTGHTISTCWHISKADKMQMAKAMQVCVSNEDEGCNECEEDDLRFVDDDSPNALAPTRQPSVTFSTEVRRVRSSVSPYFFAFIEHHTVKVVVDTGATSTLVSAAFVRKVGIKIQPTRHSARQLDKTRIALAGEVKFTISFGGINLQVDGLVNESIDCDILAGCPFCEENAVDVFPRRGEISIGDGEKRPPVVIKYGSKPASIQHDIYRVESTVLRNDSPRVLLPGEYVELKSKDYQRYEGEIALEPRVDSPLEGKWPECAITRVIDGAVRICNNTDEAIHLQKSSHLGHIRHVASPSDSPSADYANRSPTSIENFIHWHSPFFNNLGGPIWGPSH